MYITQTFWLWKKCNKIAFIGYLTRKTKHCAPIKKNDSSLIKKEKKSIVSNIGITESC